jgi:antitoxin YefM
MRRGRPSQDICPLSEFRASVATFVEQVQATQRPLVLTQLGRSAAILLAVAESQLASGQGVPHGKAQALILAGLGAPAKSRKRSA